MSKIERLLNLTAVLLDTRRPLSAADIREQVEGYSDNDTSFHRTFERDKDDLRALGIPLKLERVPGTDPPVDGYRIPPDEYYLADPGLDGDELAALHLALLTVRIDGTSGVGSGSGEQEALWKLGGVGVEAPAPEQIANLPTDPALAPLFAAISSRRRVRFPYRGETRTVDPWRLSFQRGRWYLSGWDADRTDERNFRLDRMDETPMVTDEGWSSAPAAPAGGRTLPAWELGEDEPEIVTILVDASHAAIAARQLGPTVTSSTEANGDVRFAVPVVNRDAFRSFAIGLFEHAVVADPPDLRDELVGWLSEVRSRTVGEVS